MSRTLISLVGVTALALSLAACGSDTNDSEGDNEGSNGSGDSEALEAELTWWDTSDPTNEAPAFKELIKRFNEEYPDVTIDYQSVPFADAQNKFKTAAKSESGAPDILRAEVAWVPEFASLGYLYALDGTPLLEDNEFLETPLSSNVYDDKTYGVPQVTDTLGLMYNKALFEKAGLDPEQPPTTWDEVAEAADALKSKAKVDGLYINAGGYFMLPFIYGEGGDLVDSDAQQILVNSPESVTGVTTAADLVKSGAAVKPDANDSYGTMMTLFKEGKVGMIINGPWEVANVSDDPKFGGLEEPRHRPGAGRLRRGGLSGRWSQLRDLLRHGRGEGRRGHRLRELHGLRRVPGLHRRRARSAAGQRRGLRHCRRQRAHRRLEGRAGRRQAEAVDPRGRPVLRAARRDGHRGADPGQGPAGVAGQGRQGLQGRRGAGLLGVI